MMATETALYTIIPEIWSKENLNYIKEEYPIYRLIEQNMDSLRRGDVVHFPRPATLSVNALSPESDIGDRVFHTEPSYDTYQWDGVNLRKNPYMVAPVPIHRKKEPSTEKSGWSISNKDFAVRKMKNKKKKRGNK